MAEAELLSEKMKRRQAPVNQRRTSGRGLAAACSGSPIGTSPGHPSIGRRRSGDLAEWFFLFVELKTLAKFVPSRAPVIWIF